MDIKLTPEEIKRKGEGLLLKEMIATPGWEKVFRPWLEDKRNLTFPDPQSFTEEAAFTYAAKVTSIYKKVVAELLAEIDKRIAESEFYVKKESGEILEKFAIGREENGVS